MLINRAEFIEWIKGQPSDRPISTLNHGSRDRCGCLLGCLYFDKFPKAYHYTASFASVWNHFNPDDPQIDLTDGAGSIVHTFLNNFPCDDDGRPLQNVTFGDIVPLLDLD